MAATKANKDCTNGANTENEAQPAQKGVVDASKLNELMTNLDKRLAGGLHGEYFEKGSRLDDKHRHGQLETVFGLRKELSEIKTQMEKQAESEQTKPGKGAPPGNKNMIATIKNVVQQELSEKLRDLSVRNERLEANVKKSEGRNDTLESKVKTLESKLKNAEQRNQNLQEKFSNSYVKVLETRMKKVEADNASLLGMHADDERRLTSVEEQGQRFGGLNLGRINRMQSTITRHEASLSNHAQRLNELEEWREEAEE